MRFRAAAVAAIILSLPLVAPAVARAGAAAAYTASASAASADEGAVPAVDVIEVSGLIDSPTANYIADEIAAANRRHSELLVVSISSAGGLNVRTESLVKLVLGSSTPVAVYIGPQRSTAAGTAAVLVAAAHISAIGPSGRLGPAFPTNLAVDPKSSRGRALLKATRSDLDSLAAARGRDPSLYVTASIPASVALARHQVDYEVVGVKDLLERANGRVVATATGQRTLRLDKSRVDIRFHKPGPWPRVLHTLINPGLVYVLLVAGVLLVVFEVFQPGFGVAGVTGMLLLVGGVYGLIALPTALWAIALFAAGCVLLSADVALDGLGPPTYAGLAGFLIGSLGMFSAPAGELRIAWWLAVLGAVIAFVFFVPVMTIVRRARKPIKHDADVALVGKSGQVRSMLNPEGYVWVAEGLWRARAEDEQRIRVGEDVLVTAVDGAILQVRRA